MTRSASVKNAIFYAIMGRKKNPLKPLKISLSLNSRTAWYLDRLLEKGLYGNGYSEAAKIVIFDHCKLLVGKGEIPGIPAMPGSDAKEVTSLPPKG